jgi:hypothetical protein
MQARHQPSPSPEKGARARVAFFLRGRDRGTKGQGGDQHQKHTSQALDARCLRKLGWPVVVCVVVADAGGPLPPWFSGGECEGFGPLGESVKGLMSMSIFAGYLGFLGGARLAAVAVLRD